MSTYEDKGKKKKQLKPNVHKRGPHFPLKLQHITSE
jgi:hypothetical protein